MPEDPKAIFRALRDTEQQKQDCLKRVLMINPWNEDARSALEKLDQLPVDPLSLAQTAENHRDYPTAYRYYTQAAEADPTRTNAWLGKGFSAGMLSSPERNGVPEFFKCLDSGLRTTGMITGDLRGMTPPQVANRLTPSQVKMLLVYLQDLFNYITGLVERCPPNMANIYMGERVHLADWIEFMQHIGSTDQELIFSREKMYFIILDAFHRIARNVRQSTRGKRSRLELLNTFKLYLMSNLNLSQLNHDASLISQLDDIIGESV